MAMGAKAKKTSRKSVKDLQPRKSTASKVKGGASEIDLKALKNKVNQLTRQGGPER